MIGEDDDEHVIRLVSCEALVGCYRRQHFVAVEDAILLDSVAIGSVRLTTSSVLTKSAQMLLEALGISAANKSDFPFQVVVDQDVEPTGFLPHERLLLIVRQLWIDLRKHDELVSVLRMYLMILFT